MPLEVCGGLCDTDYACGLILLGPNEFRPSINVQHDSHLLPSSGLSPDHYGIQQGNLLRHQNPNLPKANQKPPEQDHQRAACLHAAPGSNSDHDLLHDKCNPTRKCFTNHKVVCCSLHCCQD